MSHKKLFIIAGGIAVVIVGVFYFDSKSGRQEACLDIPILARNPQTGIVEGFASGCVPDGWDIVSESELPKQDWKTYRSEEYGFELKYPPEWYLSVENENVISIATFSEDSQLVFSQYPAFGQALVIVTRYDVVSDQTGEFELDLAGDMAVKWPVLIQIVDMKKGNGLNFQTVGYFNKGDPQGEVYRETIGQIFSTFKFIEPSASGAGTLSGKVSIGPICPVEQIDNPCPTPPEAYTARGFMVFLGDTSDLTKVAAIIHADSSGNYSVSLAPGIYTVRPAIVGIGYMSKDLPATVTIEPGSTVTLNIDVDTGIR